MTKVWRSPSDPCGLSNFRYLSKQLHSRYPATNDDDMFANKLIGIFILARMQLATFKFFPTRIFRAIRCFPSTGCINNSSSIELYTVCSNKKTTISVDHFSNLNRTDDR